MLCERHLYTHELSTGRNGYPCCTDEKSAAEEQSRDKLKASTVRKGEHREQAYIFYLTLPLEFFVVFFFLVGG